MYFYHLTIITRDFDKSLKFYTEYLDLNINRTEDIPGDHKLVFLADKASDTQIELVKYDAPFTASAQGVNICFMTDDVEKMHEKAVAMGLNPSDIRSAGAKVRYFYVYDPDHISIEIKQEDI